MFLKNGLNNLKNNFMEKEFTPYNLALELKELGFDEPCFGFYVPLLDGTQEFELMKFESQGKKVVLAPLWQQAFRFFREKYGLHYIICKNIQMDGYGYREVIQIPYMEENKNTIFKTYEEAELACIRKLIEIAKEQNVK